MPALEFLNVMVSRLWDRAKWFWLCAIFLKFSRVDGNFFTHLQFVYVCTHSMRTFSIFRAYSCTKTIQLKIWPHYKINIDNSYFRKMVQYVHLQERNMKLFCAAKCSISYKEIFVNIHANFFFFIIVIL